MTMNMPRRRGSVHLYLANPILRFACQLAWHRHYDNLHGMRKLVDRAGAMSNLIVRPVRGCRVVEGELAGMGTREYLPSHRREGRTVLYLHGGGYLLYAARAYNVFLSRLADGLQARVIAPAYRLAPEYPFPAAIDDCLRAYGALLDSGHDPSRLIVAGESAGANATLVTLQRARDRSTPMAAAAILMSGGFDFSWESPSIVSNAGRDALVGPRGLDFLQRWFRPDVAATDPLASPMFGDFHGLPPLLFQTGDTEVLRDDSVRAAERARAAGVKVRLEVYPLAPHAWSQLMPWLPEARDALRQIRLFADADCGWNTEPQPATAAPTPTSSIISRSTS